MRPILEIVLLVLEYYSYLIIGLAIMSWLIAFDVINLRNDLVKSIWRFLEAVTEPVLRPIRKILPNLGGIDVSPIILLLIILLLEKEIGYYAYAML